ncbi:hypothetical protein AHAS_Ahas11G0182600 [Arachis hypogaea]
MPTKAATQKVLSEARAPKPTIKTPPPKRPKMANHIDETEKEVSANDPARFSNRYGKRMYSKLLDRNHHCECLLLVPEHLA